jgi:hypothetical protein
MSIHRSCVVFESLGERIYEPVRQSHVIEAQESPLWLLTRLFKGWSWHSHRRVDQILNSCKDVHNCVLEVLGVLIEVAVEWTESWPAVVFQVGFIPQQIRILILSDWLVFIQRDH